MHKNFKDITGQKFGRLTVIKVVSKNKHRQYKWECQCDCGNISKVISSQLRNGHTKSCGCLHKDKITTHDKWQIPEYNVWASIKNRCLNKKDIAYRNWGGRGITVCYRWLKFENFFEDMGKRPKGLQIDRINNDGNYCKENCKWSTIKQQARNRRTNRIITYKGEKKCLAEWAEEFGIKYTNLQKRLKNGWSIERAFTK